MGYTSAVPAPSSKAAPRDGTNAPSLILSGAVGLSAVWWLYVLPSVALVVLLLSVTFLGDALDEAVNPAAAA